MYRKCATEKSAQQQRILEQCLLELMATVPFQDINISMLCQHAEMSRKTFYRLFDKRIDVLTALIDHTLLDIDSFQPDTTVGIGGLQYFFSFWKSQNALLEALIRNDMTSMLWERAISHALRESPELLLGLVENDRDFSRETVIFYLSGLFVLLLDWHVKGYKKSIDEMAQFVMHLFNTPPAKEPLLLDLGIIPSSWNQPESE